MRERNVNKEALLAANALIAASVAQRAASGAQGRIVFEGRLTAAQEQLLARVLSDPERRALLLDAAESIEACAERANEPAPC